MMKNAYASLALQTLVGGVIMYLVMFVMIDSLRSFCSNLNMLYMTLMMVAPMVVLMVLARAICSRRKRQTRPLY
jgi:Na+/serine symporter